MHVHSISARTSQEGIICINCIMYQRVAKVLLSKYIMWLVAKTLANVYARTSICLFYSSLALQWTRLTKFQLFIPLYWNFSFNLELIIIFYLQSFISDRIIICIISSFQFWGNNKLHIVFTLNFIPKNLLNKKTLIFCLIEFDCKQSTKKV